MSAIQQQQHKSVATSYTANMTPGDTTGIPNLKPVTVKNEVPNTPSSLDILNLNGKNQRLDLGSMIEEFIELLGKDNWIKYSQLISRFILGKLSRKELSREFDSLFGPPPSIQRNQSTNLSFSLAKPLDDSQSDINNTNENTQLTNSLLRPKLIRLHNQLLLGIFTNTLRDSPLGASDKSWGFGSSMGNKGLKRVNKHNSQIETYKKIVMSLPLSDRARLKTITKEAGKRGFIYCSVLQDRLTNIPKIPIVTNQETLKRVKANNLKTPLEWSQDIMNGFNAPLATDNYSLPDTDSLYLKMTGIAREHGLVGSVDTRCVDMMSLALDHYLKKVVELGIDSLRYRTKKYSDYYDLNEDGIFSSVTDKNNDDNFLTNNIPGLPTVIPNDINSSKNNNTESKDEEDYDKMDIDTEAEIKAETSTDDTNQDDIKPKMSLTNEDIYNALSVFPNIMKSSTSAFYNISNNGLRNDDDLVIMKSAIDDMPEFTSEKPMFTPIDERNVGTREELNWLIKDILTEK
ncbi:similar to Saccharomyces cerevisiae YPL254W HFI1 Adaptor protein required for structural integrity of the SAGA complex [Maudiozyma saulgeensis]|uniref:Similar to Saccharomyces cerevisiae YPL254W HFI1 Adaptor protein required for structural integrity of the SAGA complex n=1 Tax=Maudiozyma saulgeensis TaxID=1789683 RepID=A0A1X7R7B5_9SACH|nr:similar to Saccharomyces cerevisiae YPL254W HFI1 Adaptor protein required for structural integrity of the SAGA complex [Kazachstania saulgeensis]